MRAALTKRIVASTLPQDRPYELRDAQVRGLLLRVQPSGHKAWIVTWAHGKRRTLGSAGHLTLDQARELARKIISEFIQTGLPAIAKPKLPQITLETFLDDHYAPWAQSELKGADKYVERTKRVFAKGLSKPLSEINAAWGYSTPLAPSTTNALGGRGRRYQLQEGRRDRWRLGAPGRLIGHAGIGRA